MILVNVKKNIIEIKGHANYDDYGKDIVCSAVSSIALTTINGIISIKDDTIKCNSSEGMIVIEILKDDEITNSLINNMIIMLKELENKYPKNIKIKEGV